MVLVPQLEDDLGLHDVNAASVLFDSDGEAKRISWLVARKTGAEKVAEVAFAESLREQEGVLGKDGDRVQARDLAVVEDDVKAAVAVLEDVLSGNGLGRAVRGHERIVNLEEEVGKLVPLLICRCGLDAHGHHERVVDVTRLPIGDGRDEYDRGELGILMKWVDGFGSLHCEPCDVTLHHTRTLESLVGRQARQSLSNCSCRIALIVEGARDAADRGCEVGRDRQAERGRCRSRPRLLNVASATVARDGVSCVA